MAITKAQIFQVADELDEIGKHPTLSAVRKAIETLTQTESDHRKCIEAMGQRLAAAEANAKRHEQQVSNLTEGRLRRQKSSPALV